MSRKHRRLRTRIYLWLFPLLLVTVVLTIHQVFFAMSVNRTVRSVADEEFQVVEWLQDAIKHMESIHLRCSAGVTYDDSLKLLRADHEHLSSFVDGTRKLPPRYEQSLVKLGELISVLQQTSEKKGWTSSDQARIEILINSRLDDISGLMVQLSEQMSAAFRELRGKTVHSYLVMGIGSMLAVVLAFAISRQLSIRIARPIDALYTATEAVATGDLNVNLNVESNDEMGRLAKGFSHMIDRLKYYRELNDGRLLRTLGSLRSIMDRMPDAVFIVQDDFTVTFKNPEAEQMFATREFQLGGFPSPLEKTILEGFSHARTFIRRQLDEAVHFRIFGEERYYLIHTFPFEVVDLDNIESTDSDATTIAVMLQDVTAMQLSDRLKTDLVATVSHELKTPITSARMALYLLLEEQVGRLNEEQKTLATTARDDLERQLATIDHLLSFTRFESLGIHGAQELTSLPCLLEECTRNYSSLAQAASIGIRLRFDKLNGDGMTRSDPNGLKVVVNNLLGNAIKYAPGSSEVTLGYRHEASQLIVFVADNGPGIPVERLSSLFDPYTRGDHDAQISGSGLGLSIAKSIVEELGGEIWCESEVGKGSTFCFSIPV